jgi:hypothetical protein
MASQGMTPKEAAEALYAILPQALSPSLLEDYGIAATDERAQTITREVLSLNLYWIFAAVEAHIPRHYRIVLFGHLVGLMRADWEEQFQVAGMPWDEYMREMEARRYTYARVMQEEGSPVAVAAHAGAILEEQGAVRAEDQPKILALFTDLVPVEQYGELLENA